MSRLVRWVKSRFSTLEILRIASFLGPIAFLNCVSMFCFGSLPGETEDFFLADLSYSRLKGGLRI